MNKQTNKYNFLKQPRAQYCLFYFSSPPHTRWLLPQYLCTFYCLFLKVPFYLLPCALLILNHSDRVKSLDNKYSRNLNLSSYIPLTVVSFLCVYVLISQREQKRIAAIFLINLSQIQRVYQSYSPVIPCDDTFVEKMRPQKKRTIIINMTHVCTGFYILLSLF